MNLGNEPVFDNRELALLIWIGVGIVWASTRSGARSSMWAVVKMLCSPKIAVPLGLLFLYVGAVVAALWRAGAWTAEVASETLFWFIGTACVLFVSLDRMSQDPRFFRRTALGVLSVTVLFEFVSNLYTFSLAVELGLVPGDDCTRSSDVPVPWITSPRSRKRTRRHYLYTLLNPRRDPGSPSLIC